jgi:predicted RNA-binding protein with PIN domain
MQKIIVDGYNVIHADGELRALPMERARRELLARLRRYLSGKDVQVTVVFDGVGGMEDAEAVIPGRLQVLYSASGQTADEVIVGALHTHPNPREYIVVTGDIADIGRSVAAVGASVMSPADFLERTDARARGAGPRRAPEKPDPDEEDVDYWLELFERSEDGDAPGRKRGPRDD